MNLKNLETFDSIFFRGKSHFEDDDIQHLVFQMAYRYFITTSISHSNILSWKSKGLSDESIKPLSISNKMLNPSVNYVSTKVRVTFRRDCLKQEKISFDHGKIVNIYIVNEIDNYCPIISY